MHCTWQYTTCTHSNSNSKSNGNSTHCPSHCSLCAPIMVIMTLEAIPWSTLVPIALPITRLTFPGHQDINHTIITAQMLRLWITQWWQKLTLSPRLTFIRAKWFSKTIKTFKYTNIRIDILVLFPYCFSLFLCYLYLSKLPENVLTSPFLQTDKTKLKEKKIFLNFRNSTFLLS